MSDLLTVDDARGANFGWPALEGDIAGPHPERAQPNPLSPMHTYDHTGGPSAITGGLIMRDPTLPAGVQGRYLFADFYDGELMDFVPDLPNNEADDIQSLGVPDVSGPVAFGEGVAGQVYVTSLNTGTVYRLEAAP